MKEAQLKPGERLDDLQHDGLVIIQNKNQFCFGTDSVLLSHFASCCKAKRVCDLGTGSGVLPLLLSDRLPAATFDGVEIQAEACDMARRSVLLNQLEKRITIHEMDLLHAPHFFGKGSFDMIICNPPYGKIGTCVLCNNHAKNIARHEVMCTLEQIIETASALLCNGGHFFIVHQCDRLLEMMDSMRKCSLEPKKLQLVHPQIGKPPYLVLVEAVKNQKSTLQIQAPLIVYEENGVYTPKLRAIYGLPD